MDINKHDNFKRIAESRVNKIINSITSLGNLSNKSYYEFSKEEINSIFDAIQDELNTQRNKFNSNENSKKKKFRL